MKQTVSLLGEKKKKKLRGFNRQSFRQQIHYNIIEIHTKDLTLNIVLPHVVLTFP